MPVFTLNLDPFRLVVTLIHREIEERDRPYLDWLHCRVEGNVARIAAEVEWSVMPAELSGLADDLDNLHRSFPEPGAVELSPAEPNLQVHFNLERGGRLSGEIEMRPDVADDVRLVGTFEVDQSYLPGYVMAIRGFLKEVDRA